ncbi:MAG TPA: hypothetical protein VIS07_12600 [Candidatus Binatia bacterium]
MKSQNSSLARKDAANFTNEEQGTSRAQGVAHEPSPGARPQATQPSRRRSERAAVRDTNPFGPDVILPEQFYDQRNGTEHVSGEKALMLAVLEDGIRCFQEHLKNPRVRPRLLARQAEKWIRSTDWDWPFSFNNVCESLSLNPDCLRSKLLAPRPNGEAPPKPRPSSHRVYRLTPRVKPPRRR